MKTLITVSILLLFISFTGFAQIKFGLPKGTPDGSAILDLSNTGASSTTKKGFLGPQVALSGTADATTVPTPATGLMVYNTTAAGSGSTAVVAGYYYYNGTQWVQMVSSAAPASGNIYTADGTLTSARTVTMGTNALNFTGASGVNINTTTTSQYPLSVLQPLQSTPTQPGIIIAGASGSAVTGQSAFIAFNPNNISGAWPIIVGAQYVNGSANQSAADFIVATSSGGTPATKLVVQNGGNVGIGTTTPATKLDIKGAGSSYPATSGTAQSTGLVARLHDASNLILDMGGNGSNGFWLQATDIGSLASNYPLLLNPNAGNVGIGTTTPNSTLQVAGSAALGYSELTASATLTGSNHFVNVNSTSTTTITLPVITGILGREYIIRNTGTGTVSVVVTGGSTINAGTNSFATLTATAGQTYTLYAGSTNWQALLNVTNINTTGGAATLQSMILPATIQGIAGGTPSTAIAMGGAGTAVNITFDKAASNYANSISGADFNASNSQITLPAGIYQVIWNFVGLINFPPSPSTLNLFWDVPDGASATHRVHYASGNSATFNPYGITFVTTMQITATRIFNFSIGVGSGNASTSFGVAADARLAFIKIQ